MACELPVTANRRVTDPNEVGIRENIADAQYPGHCEFRLLALNSGNAQWYLFALSRTKNKVTRMMRVEAPRQFLPNVRSSGLALRLALAKGMNSEQIWPGTMNRQNICKS